MQFDKHVNDYDKHSQWQKKVAQQLKNFIFSQDFNEEFDEIVDLGCGTGYLSELLLEQYTTPKVLLDHSTQMLKRAKLKLGDQYHYIKADIQDDKKYLKKEKRQLIVSNLAFQWLENKQMLTLKKLYHKMNKGSKIFITTLINGAYKNYYQLLDNYGFKHSKIDFISKKHLLEFDFIRKFFFSTQGLKNDNIISFLKILHYSGAIRETNTTNISKLRSLIKNYGDQVYNEQIKIAYLMIER